MFWSCWLPHSSATKYSHIPTHSTSCSLSQKQSPHYKKTEKQTNKQKTKKEKEKKNQNKEEANQTKNLSHLNHGVHLFWFTIPGLGTCPSVWLIYLVTQSCREIFSFGQQVSIVNIFIVRGRSSCPIFSVLGPHLAWKCAHSLCQFIC